MSKRRVKEEEEDTGHKKPRRLDIPSYIRAAPMGYKNLNEVFKLRKDLVLLCLRNISEGATFMMEHIPDKFKSDIDVVLLLFEKYNLDRDDFFDLDDLPSPYFWCDSKLFSNHLFLMQAAERDFGIMNHVYSHNKMAFEFLSDSKPFIMRFIQHYIANDDSPNPLTFVSARLRDDPEVVTAALELGAYSNCLQYASERLREDFAFVLKYFQYTAWPQNQSDICPLLWCDIKFVIQVVKDYGAEYINYFDQYFRSDFSAVTRIMKVEPLVIEFVSEELKNNLDIVKPEFCECPSDEVMEHASQSVRDFILSMKVLYADYKKDPNGGAYQKIIDKHETFKEKN